MEDPVKNFPAVYWTKGNKVYLKKNKTFIVEKDNFTKISWNKEKHVLDFDRSKPSRVLVKKENLYALNFFFVQNHISALNIKYENISKGKLSIKYSSTSQDLVADFCNEQK